MEEPNLSVIKEIAGDDIDFQNNILNIIKKEFEEEVILFKENFNKKEFNEASLNIHKIKHKINLLGLKKSFDIASDYENDLKKGEITLHKKILDILNKIHVYLYN